MGSFRKLRISVSQSTRCEWRYLRWSSPCSFCRETSFTPLRTLDCVYHAGRPSGCCAEKPVLTWRSCRAAFGMAIGLAPVTNDAAPHRDEPSAIALLKEVLHENAE